jgi:hypothetical protein
MVSRIQMLKIRRRPKTLVVNCDWYLELAFLYDFRLVSCKVPLELEWRRVARFHVLKYRVFEIKLVAVVNLVPLSFLRLGLLNFARVLDRICLVDFNIFIGKIPAHFMVRGGTGSGLRMREVRRLAYTVIFLTDHAYLADVIHILE